HRVAEPAPAGERLLDGRRLEPAVDHAVAALLVAAALAVPRPLGRLHEVLEGVRVPVLEEVAGPLPAEQVVRGIAPRRALVLPLAHEELQEQRRLVEPPSPLRVPQDAAEEVVGALLPE